MKACTAHFLALAILQFGTLGICGRAIAQPVGLHVEVDPLTEMLDPIKSFFREHRAPVVVDGIGFDMTVPGAAAEDETLSGKKEFVAKWEQDLSSILEEEGYEVLDDQALVDRMQVTREQMRAMALKGQPFGMRDRAETHMGEEILILSDETADCAGRDGAKVAEIMGYYPSAGEGSEFGSVAVVVFSVGRCALDLERATDDLGDLRDHIRRSFVALERQ